MEFYDYWGIFYDEDGQFSTLCVVDANGIPLEGIIREDIQEEGLALHKTLKNKSAAFAFAYADAYCWGEEYKPAECWDTTPEEQAEYDLGTKAGFADRKGSDVR